VKLLGLILAYAAAYVVGVLVLLRLLTGQWPDRIVPGSRVDWFLDELEPERGPVARLVERLAAVIARDFGPPPRSVELFAHERKLLGVD
jgi:hypothetical protein